jgi:hypothetical protein
LKYSEEGLQRLGMPCYGSPIPSNFTASARSQHVGMVNALRMDGSVQRVSNSVDSAVWLTMHNRAAN